MNETEKQYENIRKIAEDVSAQYQDKLFNELEKIKIDLENDIKYIVDLHAGEYKLNLKNDSSKKIELYELNGRVKQKESLKEKIVRDQLYFRLREAESEEEYLPILTKNMDDLIGLRYLMSLAFDCEQMYKLIVKYEKDFNGKGIKFNNLEDNPQFMRNGRKIYRLKGEYKDFKFELQIKSKIDSAWADIEHMLFYKDHNFSYIQGTNKEVMIKIGDLLEEIDGLMLKVRDSQEEYDKKVEGMDFNQYLRKRYVNLIRKKLGSSYILTQYRNTIFEMFMKFKSETREKILALKDSPKENSIIEFEYNENCHDSVLCKNYLEMKKTCIEFSVFESMYSEWKAYEEKGYNSIDENTLMVFLCDLFASISKEYEYEENFTEWIKNKIIKILNSSIQRINCKCFFFDKEKMDMLYSFWKAYYINLIDEWEMFIDYQDVLNTLEDIIFEFFLDKDDTIDKYALEIYELLINIGDDNLNAFCFNKLKNRINDIYSEDSKNSSGKKKKANLIFKLIQAASQEME